MPTIIGALVGGTLGFLMRPAVPFLGQLPFQTVVTRGTNLSGLDLLLRGTAETSFNYLLMGVLAGAFAGWVVSRLAAKKA